jgi:ABC-type nitrate/sulfonate/bicarbonate transport system ATPase subunit
MRLKVNNLTLKYPGASSFVFRGVNIELNSPGFHSIFGPSGVGKTSLAKILTGDILDFSGHVIHQEMTTLFYCYNLERLPGWSSVGNHLIKITPANRHQRREELIDIFGISDCLHQRFSQLSLGQRNRVNLLRYLLQDFDLLIMDESLANVDEMTRETILLKIKAMFPQTHFLYISHNVVEVAKFCRDIVVLRGAGRQPQSTIVPGQDTQLGQSIDRNKLDRTMLEIVNASS